MAKVKQKVFLLTEQQRDALLNYLLNRPYREVAGGVQFLTNAPTTILNLEVPDEELAEMSAEKQLQASEEFNSEFAAPIPANEEFAVLSKV